MSERLLVGLGRIDPRALLGGMVLLVALLAFEAWVLVLRAPFAELSTLIHARSAVRDAAQGGGAEAEIARLVKDNAANARALAAALPARSDDDTVLRLIGTLGRTAARHDVVLGSVKSGRRGVIAGVDEQIYEVEARGTYRELCAWLGEARRDVAPLVVVELVLRSIDQGRRIGMTLRLAAYRSAVTARPAS